jgi:carbon storage regulator CsrA
MLVLSRYPDGSVVLDFSQCPPGMLATELPRMTVMVLNVNGCKVRLGFDSPNFVHVHRQEVMEAIDRERAARPKLTPEQREEISQAIRRSYMGLPDPPAQQQPGG